MRVGREEWYRLNEVIGYEGNCELIFKITYAGELFEEGYGFIRPNDGGKDIFFDISTIKEEDRKNIFKYQIVRYGVVHQKDAEMAIDIELTGLLWYNDVS